MKTRPLGTSGIEVSAVGFGSWAIGGDMWGPQDDADSLAALTKAWERGCTFFDTAAVYGMGHSETLLGAFFRETGAKPVIATKVPPKNFRWPAAADTPLEEAFPPEHVVSQTEESLRRLGVERVDLQQLHVWTDSWCDRDEWIEALERLREQGKIRTFGISLNTFEPDSGLRIAEAGRIHAFQVVHNIFEQAPEDRLYPAAKERGIGIIDRVPFDESSLTGKLTPDTVFAADDFRARFFKDTLEETVTRVEALRWLVPDFAPSLAEAALRFCLSHEAVSTVIPGMRTVEQVEQNLAAADAGPLPEEALARLRDHRWNRKRGLG